MWETKLIEVCSVLNIEPELNEDKITFRCPSEPGDKIKTEIDSIVPKQYQCEFIVAPKETTLDTIRLIIKQSGAFVTTIQEKYNLVIIILSKTIEISQEDLDRIKKVIESDKFYKSFEILIDGHNVSFLASEIAKNNTIREKIINADDVENLKILLNTEESFETFLEKV